MTLEEAVEAFLGIAMLEPEKEPKTQRAQRENRARVIGYAQAQNHLRQILKQAGKERLSEVRHKDSPRPMKAGDMNIWIAS